MKRRAFITGITGQDGSYLAEHLLDLGYDVTGMVRRSSNPDLSRLAGIVNRIRLVPGDMMDQASLCAALKLVTPDEVYNLAAQSDVHQSYGIPFATMMATGIGAASLFHAVRDCCPNARVYQASSSEMFGSSPSPQSEITPFAPVSPYATAKLYAHQMARIEREGYGAWIACGILFNHESPRRGPMFVTKKLVKAAVAIKNGKLDKVQVGDLSPRRDWGHAKDYVRAMHMLLQRDHPMDVVIGTGVSHTVRKFADDVFEMVGLEFDDHHEVTAKFARPIEVCDLRANAFKADKVLGWKPRITYDELVEEMVNDELERAT